MLYYLLIKFKFKSSWI